MAFTLHLTGFREVETKTGKNAGRKTLFFSCCFQCGDRLLCTTGWRLFDKAIHPLHTQYSFGRILNLSCVDSITASEIYFKLREILPTLRETHPEFANHELAESVEEGIRLIKATKADLKKFAPELHKDGPKK
jgi:hypothetical protein